MVQVELDGGGDVQAVCVSGGHDDHVVAGAQCIDRHGHRPGGVGGIGREHTVEVALPTQRHFIGQVFVVFDGGLEDDGIAVVKGLSIGGGRDVQNGRCSHGVDGVGGAGFPDLIGHSHGDDVSVYSQVAEGKGHCTR